MSAANAQTLWELRQHPPRLGRLAAAARDSMFGKAITVDLAPEHANNTPASIARCEELVGCDRWPEAALWREGDRVVCAVEPEQGRAWADYLLDIASELPAACSLAPFSPTAAGTHRLWLIAAARIALPRRVRIEARHDLLGARLAQLALAFGADTLSGPIGPDRKLPLAGTTRPNETSRAGLSALVEQAGLRVAEASP